MVIGFGRRLHALGDVGVRFGGSEHHRSGEWPGFRDSVLLGGWRNGASWFRPGATVEGGFGCIRLSIGQ
jgi:hypothetical protein